METTKTMEGSTANEGATCVKTVSKVGLVKQRPQTLDKIQAEQPSGRSSIDPGGSQYDSKSSNSEQD